MHGEKCMKKAQQKHPSNSRPRETSLASNTSSTCEIISNERYPDDENIYAVAEETTHQQNLYDVLCEETDSGKVNHTVYTDIDNKHVQTGLYTDLTTSPQKTVGNANIYTGLDSKFSEVDQETYASLDSEIDSFQQRNTYITRDQSQKDSVQYAALDMGINSNTEVYADLTNEKDYNENLQKEQYTSLDTQRDSDLYADLTNDKIITDNQKTWDGDSSSNNELLYDNPPDIPPCGFVNGYKNNNKISQVYSELERETCHASHQNQSLNDSTQSNFYEPLENRQSGLTNPNYEFDDTLDGVFST